MRNSTSFITLASLCLLSLVSGCLYEIRDEILDFEISMRNHHRACDAWRRCQLAYKSIDHYRDFKYGFIKGYTAVATGGNGCPPVLPPDKYWKVCYQNEEGKDMTNAWFDGYSHGAVAADDDGVAELNEIVTRGGRHDDGHPMVQPAPEHGMPTEVTPVDSAKDYWVPPLPDGPRFSGPEGRARLSVAPGR